MVWFNRLLLRVPTAQILEFYPIALANSSWFFKRMKSILGVGPFAQEDPLSAQDLLEGKLFCGLLIERMIHAGLSPGATTLPLRRQPVARG